MAKSMQALYKTKTGWKEYKKGLAVQSVRALLAVEHLLEDGTFKHFLHVMQVVITTVKCSPSSPHCGHFSTLMDLLNPHSPPQPRRWPCITQQVPVPYCLKKWVLNSWAHFRKHLANSSWRRTPENWGLMKMLFVFLKSIMKLSSVLAHSQVITSLKSEPNSTNKLPNKY